MAIDLFHQTAAGYALMPERLTEAREAMGWTMAELAEKIEVTRQAVSQFELGIRQPDPLTMINIVRELDQPMGYFTSARPPGNEPVGTVYFRSFKSRTKTSQRAFNVWRKWVGQIAHYLAEYVDLPAVHFLTLDNLQEHYTDDDIEEIAVSCRRHWGLGDGPIGNMTALLESKGCVVTLSQLGVTNVDAFSCWQSGRPFVFLGSDKGSACRSRFDAAHELGHLILHGGITEAQIGEADTLDRIEREANRFASCFLLPYRTFPSEIFSHRIAHFVELKRRWKASIRAMAYRCNQIEIFDEDRMLNFWKQMSACGYTKREPLDDQIAFEYPALLRKATELVFGNQVKRPSEMLGDLRLSSRIISQACQVEEKVFASPESAPIALELMLKKEREGGAPA